QGSLAGQVEGLDTSGHLARSATRLAQQGLKAHLNEERITRQRFSDTSLLHQDKGDAIRETPSLARSTSEQGKGPGIKVLRERNDFDPGIPFERLQHADTRAPVSHTRERAANLE